MAGPKMQYRPFHINEETMPFHTFRLPPVSIIALQGDQSSGGNPIVQCGVMQPLLRDTAEGGAPR